VLNTFTLAGLIIWGYNNLK